MLYQVNGKNIGKHQIPSKYFKKVVVPNKLTNFLVRSPNGKDTTSKT